MTCNGVDPCEWRVDVGLEHVAKTGEAGKRYDAVAIRSAPLRAMIVAIKHADQSVKVEQAVCCVTPRPVL